jgi:hypothetical protein
MTEKEIIKAAKTNWMCWQGLKVQQPEVAEWMERHWEDIGMPTRCKRDGWVKTFNREPFNVYRLRPDYEPLKWFFHPSTGHVIPRNTMTENEPPSDWMEVTPEYAEYLRDDIELDAYGHKIMIERMREETKGGE